MKKHRLLAVLLCLLPFGAAPEAQVIHSGTPSTTPNAIIEREIAVQFRDGAIVRDVIRRVRPIGIRRLEGLGVYIFTFRGTAAHLEAVREVLQREGGSLWAETSRAGKVTENYCDDGIVLDFQCTVAFIDGSAGPGDYDAPWFLQSLNVPAPPVPPLDYQPVVAVLDTGIDLDNLVFSTNTDVANPNRARLLNTGFDFVNERPEAFDLPDQIDNDGNRAYDEAYGHGTAVASLVLSVNPDALILPVKVMNDDGWGTTADVARGIVYAVDQGADVVNISFSTYQESYVIAAALAYAELHGVNVTTSAGNIAKGHVLFPGGFDSREFLGQLPASVVSAGLSGTNMLTVSGIDSADIRSRFACYGEGVSIVAPAEELAVAYPGNQFVWWRGTSMASGIAAGAVSRIVAATGGRTGAVPAAHRLAQTSLSVDGANPYYAGQLGRGKPDVAAAISCATDPDTCP